MKEQGEAFLLRVRFVRGKHLGQFSKKSQRQERLVINMKTPIQVVKAAYQRAFYYCAPAKVYLNRSFKAAFGRNVDWKQPRTFNEKLQWLKVYDHNPLYTQLADKYEVRKFVADRVGKQYLIPILGVWDRFKQIDFDSLPQRFVLKTNHDCGGVVICPNKDKFDREAARKKLTFHLKKNFYYNGREWPYKHIRPRIVAEQFISDDGETPNLTDYKFFCFHGKPDCVMLCMDRVSGSPRFYFFDREWNLLRYNQFGKDAPDGFTVPKVPTMDAMFEIAERLSAGIPTVRVDLYTSGERIYFGEMTFYSGNGLDKALFQQTDELWGSKIDLTEVRR